MNKYSQASKLRQERRITGITSMQMTKELDIDLQTYKQYESAKLDIPKSVLVHAASIRGVSPANLGI